MPNTSFIPYFRASYQTPVPIFDCPYIFLSHQQQVLAWKKFNTTMPTVPYTVTLAPSIRQELSWKNTNMTCAKMACHTVTETVWQLEF